MLYPGESVVCNEPDLVLVAGSFEVDSTNDVTVVHGTGFQVDRTAAGVFEITMANAYPMLVSCVASVQADTAATLDDFGVSVGTYTPSTGVLELLSFVPDTDHTTEADADGPRINFVAVFHRRTSLSIARSA